MIFISAKLIKFITAVCSACNTNSASQPPPKGFINDVTHLGGGGGGKHFCDKV